MCIYWNVIGIRMDQLDGNTYRLCTGSGVVFLMEVIFPPSALTPVQSPSKTILANITS